MLNVCVMFDTYFEMYNAESRGVFEGLRERGNQDVAVIFWENVFAISNTCNYAFSSISIQNNMQFICSLEIEPTTLVLLAPCATWAAETKISASVVKGCEF